MKPSDTTYSVGRARAILLELSLQSPWPAPDDADGCTVFADWYVAEANDTKPREVVPFIDHCYKEAARGAGELWPAWWKGITDRQRAAVAAFLTRGLCEFLGLEDVFKVESSWRYGNTIQNASRTLV